MKKEVAIDALSQADRSIGNIAASVVTPIRLRSPAPSSVGPSSHPAPTVRAMLDRIKANDVAERKILSGFPMNALH